MKRPKPNLHLELSSRSSVRAMCATRSAMVKALLIALFASMLAACGDYGSSGSSTAAPPLGGGSGGGSSANSIAAFGGTVYPIVTANCLTCHAGSGPGSPHIAHNDLATAHQAVVGQQKVNFASPDSSRLVQRLVSDFHYCWSNCAADGAVMQLAIEEWANQIDFGGGGIGVSGLSSNALGWDDGAEPGGAERYGQNVVAFWDFKEGSGTVAYDTSGVAPALDLALSGDVEWLSTYGIQNNGGKAQATRDASRKLYDQIGDMQTGSGQYSVELWMTAANTDQEGPARIVSYSQGTGQRNFTLGQVAYQFNFRNRNISEELGDNGTPALLTYDVDEDLQDRLQHVVATYDRYRGRRIYVDGVFTDDEDARAAASLFNWNPDFFLVIGNETSNNRVWQGQVRMAAIYRQALTEAQITQNYNAGVGKRLVMSFDVSQWTGPGTYIRFNVSELDDYSYLFCAPTFVGPGNPNGLRVSNIRIAVNGVVPISGQAFRTLDMPVTGSNQQLSNQCSVVAKGAGPLTDQFSVVFENLGNYQDPYIEPDPGVPPTLPFPDPVPFEGVRDFARLNASMSSATGVSSNAGNIPATYDELAQQLPATYDLRSFVSSHQVGVAKLALEYCDVLVESPALRQSFFGPFDFSQPATTFDNEAQRDMIIDSLTTNIVGDNIANQPNRAEVEEVLDTMFDTLTAGCDAASCPAERTETVVKAACASVMSSAAATVH